VRAAQVAGLCYVGRNVVQIMASYPVGILADRFGALSVMVGGYVLGILTAALTAVAFGQPRNDRGDFRARRSIALSVVLCLVTIWIGQLIALQVVRGCKKPPCCHAKQETLS
jgi:MFS family permease